jgi:tRNA threonylcarbamoyladenosine biosynthesis protein TsaB
MNLLAFDTSTEAFSVALQWLGKTLCHYELAPRLHAQKILPTIDHLLREASATLAQMDALIFGRGPGAFTGVRTAVGVVQGLAYALDKPVLGISTLMAMAEGARREHGVEQVISGIDARMGEVYWAAFEWRAGQWHTVVNEMVCAPSLVQWPSFKQAFAVGSAWPAFQSQWQVPSSLSLTIENNVRYPDARDMLMIAEPAIARGEAVSAYHAEPVYLRDHVADKPAAKK